ncbi:MAG: bifunctional phosphopantothenoylcysteine decarboxylase/phosphopantothenate--cysteine ligase CoaBC [Propionibacteriaceae bacterium]
MAKIVLGVSGGIAAYKACDVLRQLRKAGHDVSVIPTTAALEFVGKATWEALSSKPVNTGVFDAPETVEHVRLGHEADLVIVAPATADLLARSAQGRADDLLTTTLLMATCPVVLWPAMHTAMWTNAATQANVETLRRRGIVVVDPAVGALTGPDSGPGRLPDPEEIVTTSLTALTNPEAVAAIDQRDLNGKQVLISAGGTREQLDPVRFLGNNSSGLMGYALARAARLRGAQVTLVQAHCSLADPAGVEVIKAATTQELLATMLSHAPSADIIIMAAAPADFTPANPNATKITKEALAGHPLTVELTATPDILQTLCRSRQRKQVIVGFAAETTATEAELISRAQAKRQRKGCDVLVANNVSGGAIFQAPDTDVVILDGTGVWGRDQGSKDSVAHTIISSAVSQL